MLCKLTLREEDEEAMVEAHESRLKTKVVACPRDDALIDILLIGLRPRGVDKRVVGG